MSFLPFVFLAILHVHLTAVQGFTFTAAVAGGELLFEDGYTVSTVLDGDKSNIKVNPHSILHQSPPSDLFILLDSTANTFYSLSLSTTSNETVLKRFAGNGESGYADGDLDTAKFNNPGSFAVDFNGNVYVADSRNHAIRKITQSGVTTIAGGFSQKDGRTDGPGRDASFSNNFELTFVPQICALMISDHGHRLLRQINLKAADCTRHSGSVLGSTNAWLLGLGLGLSCLLSLVVGFVIHPYIMPYVGVKLHQPSWTWTHCLMNLGRQIMILCSDIRNGIVKSPVYTLFHQLILLSLSQLSLMFRPLLVESRSRTIRETPVSLLDLDEVRPSSSSDRSVVFLPQFEDQLKDLLGYDGGSMLSVNSNEMVEQEDETSLCDDKNIDGMIQANLVNFEKQAPKCSLASPDCRLGLVKRR